MLRTLIITVAHTITFVYLAQLGSDLGATEAMRYLTSQGLSRILRSIYLGQASSSLSAVRSVSVRADVKGRLNGHE